MHEGTLLLPGSAELARWPMLYVPRYEVRRGDVPFSTRHSQAHGEGLYDEAGVSAHTCAAAAGIARDRALRDWAVECELAQVAEREIPED